MLRIYFSGRVDANGLAEHRVLLSAPCEQRASSAEQQPVTVRPIAARSGAPCPPREYDRVLQYEADEEQALCDEAQDEASRARAESFGEHSEDVP